MIEEIQGMCGLKWETTPFVEFLAPLGHTHFNFRFVPDDNGGQHLVCFMYGLSILETYEGDRAGCEAFIHECQHKLREAGQ